MVCPLFLEFRKGKYFNNDIILFFPGEDKRNLIEDESLRKLKQLHRNEVTEYLQRMHKEAGVLQDICHKAFLRAESEAKLKGYENGIIVETSC